MAPRSSSLLANRPSCPSYRRSRVIQACMLIALLGLPALACGYGGCTSVVVSLSPALIWMSTSSDAKGSPPPNACANLKKIVNGDPQCLCQALGANGSPTGIPIDPARALSLASACKVQAPPISRCSSPTSSFNP